MKVDEGVKILIPKELYVVLEKEAKRLNTSVDELAKQATLKHLKSLQEK